MLESLRSSDYSNKCISIVLPEKVVVMRLTRSWRIHQLEVGHAGPPYGDWGE